MEIGAQQVSMRAQKEASICIRIGECVRANSVVAVYKRYR